jgi:septal ring factor EnvC (AmiA/AmiB activator)
VADTPEAGQRRTEIEDAIKFLEGQIDDVVRQVNAIASTDTQATTDYILQQINDLRTALNNLQTAQNFQPLDDTLTTIAGLVDAPGALANDGAGNIIWTTFTSSGGTGGSYFPGGW